MTFRFSDPTTDDDETSNMATGLSGSGGVNTGSNGEVIGPGNPGAPGVASDGEGTGAGSAGGADEPGSLNDGGTSNAGLENYTWFGYYTHYPTSAGGEVYALYNGLLERNPDPSSDYWLKSLNEGTSLESVTQSILGSAEGQPRFNDPSNAGYVEELYQTVLGRAGDAAGAAYWTAALNGGLSRAAAADGFVFSAEHLDQLQPAFDAGIFVPDTTAADVSRLYYGVLDRSPDTGGLQAWHTQADFGTSLSAIAQSFLLSPEYAAQNPTIPTDAAYVAALYEGALGRAPEAAGAQYWESALASQALTRADVAVGISESAEAHTYLSAFIEEGWLLA
ncbi:DUF4214 domain-containing protein [Methylobacterium segetis]|uniref:DUF4214 domain-containing protein n=1 Tax=Methylobacterium segetis TaxID=2488750 RepID=UPI001046651E|nr:DUF4214 domain-containing protein [Methylobacterium segetis]